MSTLFSQETLTLLYPLGYVSSLPFAIRFFIQWLYSESKGKSLVPPLFWWLSLIGNILLFTHATLQMQFHVSLAQVINGVISWRNLNLLKTPEEQKSFLFTLLLMLSLSAATIGYYSLFSTSWFSAPTLEIISWEWHLLGTLGIFLFSSRFIVQWWNAEWDKKSGLTLSFWWMSLVGGALSILYFARIEDPVNLIGPLVGIVPYLRNIMLIYKKQPEAA